jgi:hypothetical protein
MYCRLAGGACGKVETDRSSAARRLAPEALKPRIDLPPADVVGTCNGPPCAERSSAWQRARD